MTQIRTIIGGKASVFDQNRLILARFLKSWKKYPILQQSHYVSLTSKTDDWLMALNMAVNARFPDGILEKKGKPKLISDNGCQPTSEAFMKVCSQLKIKQIFTTWNNPKGNADTERFFRTLKEDLVWTNEWNLPFDFQCDFETWISQYNHEFPHQSLAYKTPSQSMALYVSRNQKKEVQKYLTLSLSFA